LGHSYNALAEHQALRPNSASIFDDLDSFALEGFASMEHSTLIQNWENTQGSDNLEDFGDIQSYGEDSTIMQAFENSQDFENVHDFTGLAGDLPDLEALLRQADSLMKARVRLLKKHVDRINKIPTGLKLEVTSFLSHRGYQVPPKPSQGDAQRPVG
jgi:hypothetical protein